jgi:hypothetical protein
MKTLFKSLFTKPYGVFYSDLSPIRRAWLALWERPRGNHDEAVEMKNKESKADSNIDLESIPRVSFGATTIIRPLPPQSDRTVFPQSLEAFKKRLMEEQAKMIAEIKRNEDE